jgi:hypothetical protein
MSSKASKAKHSHKPAGEHAGHAAAKAKVAEPLPPTVWVEEMMESLTGAQKRWIDLASEQNALLLKAIAEGVNFYKSAPTPAFADWAKQGVEGIVEAQRRWADAASMQSKQFDFGEVRRTASDVTAKGLEAFVKARTQWLDFVVAQNAMTLKAMRDNLGLDDNSSATALADFAQQAVTNYVEVQKRWLDLAAQLPFFRPADKK